MAHTVALARHMDTDEVAPVSTWGDFGFPHCRECLQTPAFITGSYITTTYIDMTDIVMANAVTADVFMAYVVTTGMACIFTAYVWLRPI